MSVTEPGDPRTAHLVDAVPYEARPFQGQRAGVVTRTAANVVDFVVTVVAVAAGYTTWSAAEFLIDPRRFHFPAPGLGVLLICGGSFLFLYFTSAWATTGRTYGDHLLGLRVVNFRGERVRLAAALVRAGSCVALPIGLYWAAVSPTNRSLQDTVLRTSVIYDWSARGGSSPMSVAIDSSTLPGPGPVAD